MFHATIPPNSVWSPAQLAQSQGFVIATNDSPRITAYIWNPVDGLTASYQPSSDWGNNPTGLSARKQGGYIAINSSSRWSVYSFDAATGFGSLNYDVSASNVRAVKFSPYGDLLAVATTSAVTYYRVSPSTGVVASSAQTLSSQVTNITDIDFAPDGSYFLVVGKDGDRVEVFPLSVRKNTDAFGQGQVCETRPSYAPGVDDNGGDSYGYCKISGRCANGYHYYCYNSKTDVYYQRIIDGIPQTPTSIWFEQSPWQQPHGMAFLPDKNFLLVTYANEKFTYGSAGTDVRSYALTDNVSYRSYSSSVGSFANQLGTSNRGGLAYNCTYMENYDAIVLANWDNLGNTHPLTTLTIDSSGSFTEVTRPVASGTVRDGQVVDWL